MSAFFANRRRTAWTVAALVIAVLAPPAYGTDRVSLAGVKGSDGMGPGTDGSGYRLGMAWEIAEPWRSDGVNFERSVEVSGGTVHDGNNGRNARLSDLGVAGVVRAPAGRVNGTESGFYFEGGFGIHRLFSKKINGTTTGSHFQFGTRVGLGYRFAGGRYALGYRLLHLSNASLVQPNPGFNFHLFLVTLEF